MHRTPSLALCIALPWALFAVAPAPAQLRIYTDAERLKAHKEAREECQPLVLLFYNSTLVRFGSGQWNDPQGRIELFFDSRGWERQRDAALAKAVVVLLNKRFALSRGGWNVLCGKTLTEGYYGSRTKGRKNQ